jgi:insulysin
MSCGCPTLTDAFDAGLIASLAAQLTPENVMVTVVSPEVTTDREETWYGTPYSRRPLQLAGAALPAPAEAGLTLPGPNPFIPAPEQLAVIDADMQRPALLEDAAPVTLWHYADTSFGQPRAAFWFSVRSAFANDNPRNDMLSQLYVRLLKDQLNEFTYPATLAGLHFDIYRHVRGFTVKLDGYNARQDALLQAILPKLRQPELSEARFEAVKAELTREIQNRERDRPYQQTAREIMELMLRPGWTDELELEALAPLTLADLRDYLPVLFSRVELVALAHGNLDAGAARDMAAGLAGGLLAGTNDKDVPAARIVRLGAGDDYLRRLAIDHPDSAITMYFQGPDRQVRTRAVVELFAQLVSAPFYNDLRTEKQLGYVVFAGPSTLLDVPGLMFVVQSPVATPGMLENHIQAFLHDYLDALPQMNSAQFEANKQGLISRLMQADERLSERSERLWQEIDLGYRQFDSREQLVAAIEPLDLQTVSSAMADWLLGAQSRRVAITALGQAGDAQEQPEMVRSPAPQLIEHPASFGRFKQTYLASGRSPAPSEDGRGDSRGEPDAVAPPSR